MGEPALTVAVAHAPGMEALGVAIADALGDRASLLALSGELGTGKTTLARGLLRRLGVEGAIRSPTYTLIEPYDLHGRVVYHLDLYRVSDPEELDYMGVRDLLAERALVLVEWPERGGRSMPAPDLALAFSHAPPGRVVTLSGATSAGAAVLDRVRLPPACAVLP